MNEPDFENELRAIRPAQPRRALENRIAAELAVPTSAAATAAILPRPERRRVPNWIAALGWSALGAVIAFFAIHATEEPQQSSAASAEPARQEAASLEEPEMDFEHEILDVADGGLIEESSAGLARIVRYESLERRRWTEQDGAITVLEVPRQDVVLVPVSFQ